MTPVKNRRTAGRVELARGINVQIVAIDGTWRRQCTMQDVSETGAKLKIEGTVEKLSNCAGKDRFAVRR
jgi:hypothetical protein